MSAPRIAHRLAGRHHGVISRQQLVDGGLTPAQIRGLAISGQFVRIDRDLFRSVSAPVTYEQSVAIALAAAGDAAAASHGCAARLFHLGVPGFNQAGVEVTVQVGHATRHADRFAVVHRTRHLDRQDLARVNGLRVTHPLRTAIDCAISPNIPPDLLRALVDDVLFRHGTPERLRDAWTRSGRRTNGWLDDALAPYSPGPAPGSPKEMSLSRICWLGGLPLPDRQVVVADPRSGKVLGRCDLGYRDARLGLEYLGQRFHAPRHGRADAVRHDHLEMVGWKLLYATREHLVQPGSAAFVHRVARSLLDRLPPDHPMRQRVAIILHQPL